MYIAVGTNAAIHSNCSVCLIELEVSTDPVVHLECLQGHSQEFAKEVSNLTET